MFGSTSAYTVSIVDDFRQRIGRRMRHERLPGATNVYLARPAGRTRSRRVRLDKNARWI